jgi:hypothetical protein
MTVQRVQSFRSIFLLCVYGCQGTINSYCVSVWQSKCKCTVEHFRRDTGCRRSGHSVSTALCESETVYQVPTPIQFECYEANTDFLRKHHNLQIGV